MENNFKAFSERINLAIDQVGDTKDLSEKMGVSQSTLKSWCSGSSEPSRSHLLKMSEVTKLSVGWLASGEGSPYIRPSASPPPTHVDLDSLEKIIALSRKQSMKKNLILKPEAEARLIRLAYEFYLRQGGRTDDACLKNLLELASFK